MLNFLTNINNITLVNNIALCVICALCITYIGRLICGEKNPGIKSNDKNNDFILYLIIIAAALIGTAVRLYRFGGAPGGFFCDEAMSAIDSKAIADYGTDHYGMKLPIYFQAWKNGQQSIMLGYLAAPFMKIFGLTKIAIRLPMLIVSIIAAVCMVLTVKDMFGKKAAAIAAVIAAVNPWHFLEGRWGLDCYMLPHFFIISVYLLNKGFKGKRIYLYISMIFFGLSMYTYGISIYTIPLFLAIFGAYAVIKKHISIKELIISALIYLIIAFPYILCIMVNFFKWDTIQTPIFTIPRFYETQRQGDILFFMDEPLKQLMINLKELKNLIVFQQPDSATPAHAVEGFGTLYLCTLPLAVIGIVNLFTKKDAVTRAILISALVMGLIGSLITYPYTWRIAILFYPVMVLAASGLCSLTEKVKYSGYVSAAACIIIFSMFTATYYTTYSETMQKWFFKGFCDALEYAEEFDTDKYYITSNSRSSDTPKESEAWTLFFHNIDARYYQGLTNENNGKTYLPYKERYHYGKLTENDIKEDENAVYIVGTEDLHLFDESKYNFREFPGYQTNYSVVTKK